MKTKYLKPLFITAALMAAGIGPNLFVIAQAGYSKLSNLAVDFLFPSIAILIILFIAGNYFGLNTFSRQLKNGFYAGLLGTIGLEIVREIGFHLGGMPGDMPKLLGVLLLDQFASGPDTISNIAGWSYHFWNGASFGIIYSLLIGKGNKLSGILFGILVGIGFMASPVVIALGVGRFGIDFGWGFPVTVTLAHIAFGWILGLFIYKKNPENSNLLTLIINKFHQEPDKRNKN